MGWFSAKRDARLEEVREALASVPDPERECDVLATGRVEGLSMENGVVRFVLNAPAQRAAVRRVVITLTARESVPNQPPQTYTLTSDVRLRNP